VTTHGALTAAFEDVIVFTNKQYASDAAVLFGLWGNIYQRSLFPLAALLGLLTCVRNRQKWLHNRVLRTCAAFGLAGFIGCFPRPDGPHIGFAAPLVCPLLAYCVRQLTRRWQPKYRYVAAALAIASFIPAARWFWWTMHAALHREVVALPGGSALLPREAQDLAKRIAAAPADDSYFFYPYMPMLPFLTARRHLSRYDISVPGYTSPSQYQKLAVLRYGMLRG
jgi:hypothetical protein